MRGMHRRWIIVVAALLVLCAVGWGIVSAMKQPAGAASPGDAAEGAVKLASLHPLLSEMAQSIGGDAVQVVDLFPAAADLHSFTPSGAAVAAASGSRYLLACGKGVEPYLDDLRDSLPGVTILELGEGIDDVLTPDGHTRDPHWWNTPENMKRAAAALCAALQQALPAHSEEFAARYQAYAQAMDGLMRQARLALAGIPKARRVLVSEHAAMCHFCAAFHFTPIAVQGVARESEGDTARLAQLLSELRASGVSCLFSDMGDSPRFLQNLATQTGARLSPLYMDGAHPTGKPLSYEQMFLHNVDAIRRGLAPERHDTP